MSLILQIETATPSCSVALAENGTTIACREINERNIHAEVITCFIDELIKQTAIAYQELDAIAVSSGPGSYTGLRIGVSTAKGLCYALDKPLIAIETLEAMAKGIIDGAWPGVEKGMLVCPMIDARRMEVYTAIFDTEGRKIKPTAAEIIDSGSFGELLSKYTVLFFGDGASKCEEALGSNPNARFKGDFINSAAHLSGKAFEKFRAQQFEDVAYFEPFYLKDFIAGKKKAL